MSLDLDSPFVTPVAPSLPEPLLPESLPRAPQPPLDMVELSPQPIIPAPQPQPFRHFTCVACELDAGW